MCQTENNFFRVFILVIHRQTAEKNSTNNIIIISQIGLSVSMLVEHMN